MWKILSNVIETKDDKNANVDEETKEVINDESNLFNFFGLFYPLAHTTSASFIGDSVSYHGRQRYQHHGVWTD